MVKQMHQWTHLGVKKLKTTGLNSKFHVIGLTRLVEDTVLACVPCQKINACRTKAEPNKRLRGDRPGTYWEVDFTEIKPACQVW